MTTDTNASNGIVEPFETIGAFLDGERVNSDALKDALSSGEGRQYLVDLVALRELADGHTSFVPSVDARSEHGPSVGSLRSSRSSSSKWMRPLAVAAALFASVAGGYVAGHRTVTSGPLGEPGTSTAIGRSAGRVSPPVVAPVPTIVIKLRPGVDWQETTGGN